MRAEWQWHWPGQSQWPGGAGHCGNAMANAMAMRKSAVFESCGVRRVRTAVARPCVAWLGTAPQSSVHTARGPLGWHGAAAQSQSACLSARAQAA